MKLKDITLYIDNKIEKNPNFIVFSYYDIRVKLDLSEEETNEFLRLSRIRLENLGYKVYFTGAKYIYDNTNRIVEDNELLVAIKGQVGQS